MKFLPADPHLSFSLASTTRPAPSRAFRFPQDMHVPGSAVAIDFHLDPDIRWIGRSFFAWLRPPAIEVPAWLR